ncbi:MAG: hypothetical protein EXR72_22115 [Myxococcales bacterium]|nr:hypothetical protein [Myxococcales bacterium]
MKWLLLVAALALSGCFPEKTFTCGGDDTRCAAGDHCIGGHCAAVDPGCAGGFRFTRSAGSLAGTCLDMVPDGGIGCLKDGDSCTPSDPCSENGKCEAGICKGTPKVCPAQSCAFGVQTVQACVKGQCVATNTPCDPFLCDGVQCAKSCKAFIECKLGNYCAAGLCLSCNDVLSNITYVPQFAPPVPIPGINEAKANDESPYLTSDGMTLLFASDRAGGLGGLDIYQATRLSNDPQTPFAMVKSLGKPLNSPADDLDPLTLDGKTYFLSSDRDSAFDTNLLASTLAMQMFSFPDPIPGTGLALPMARDEHPTLTGDGKRLYFHSDRTSPPPGDPFPHVFLAARPASSDPFEPPSILGGLPVQGVWTSPSVGKGGLSLYAINTAVPSRPEPAFVHLDNLGTPTGSATLITGLDLARGKRVSVSADGCTILFSSKAADPAGDLMWATRVSYRACGAAVCGIDDGCCPLQCAGTEDADCPYPRTLTVTEWYSQSDDTHTYLLYSEKAPGGYVATGVTLRLFASPLAGTAPLYRLSTNKCGDNKLYTYVGPEATRPDFITELNGKPLGYVNSPTSVRGTARVHSAVKDGGHCDQQLTFDAAVCKDLAMQKGYKCDQLGIGFGVKP